MSDRTGVTPDVSVVVASFSGEERLSQCLDSLLPQCARAEVIAACNLPPTTLARLSKKYVGVQFLAGVADSSVFVLRSLGAGQARGRIVAFLEDHCTVAPQWLTALIDAHQQAQGIVGGPVDNGNVHRAYDWALYFCEYGFYMPPQPDGPTLALSGVNVTYRRELLESCQPIWKQAFRENEVHDALLRDGRRLFVASEAIAYSHLNMSLSAAVAHLYSGGRHFGAYRLGNTSLGRRLLFRLASPAVPLVLFTKIIRRIASRRPLRLLNLLYGLPFVVLLIMAWSGGEALGYLAARPRSFRHS